MQKRTWASLGPLLFALLSSSIGCEQPNPRLKKPSAADRLFPTQPFSGVVPCSHPMPRRVAFDESTAVGVSAQDAFADIEGQCSAPFAWTDGEQTEISIEVVLDKSSAAEVSYPVTDTCVKNELEIQADIALSTSDGKLLVRQRGAFKYTPQPSGSIRSSAELIVSTEVVSGAAEHGTYDIQVGGAGPACAGEIRWLGDVRTGPASPGGTWSANGCPLGQMPVDADSSPEIDLRMQQLKKAWRDARLDAAWENGDKTQLELDVEQSSAPICKGQYGSVKVPVEVRYGTADSVIPLHDALGSVSFDVTKNEVSLSLTVEEETDCSTLSESAPRYCENLSAATLRLEATHPNAPSRRLTRLIVNGTLIGSNSNAKTQQVLHAAGTPHAVECLFTQDCAVDEICDDGFCRERSKTQTSQGCSFDSDCIGKGGQCRAGTCSL